MENTIQMVESRLSVPQTGAADSSSNSAESTATVENETTVSERTGLPDISRRTRVALETWNQLIAGENSDGNLSVGGFESCYGEILKHYYKIHRLLHPCRMLVVGFFSYGIVFGLPPISL